MAKVKNEFWDKIGVAEYRRRHERDEAIDPKRRVEAEQHLSDLRSQYRDMKGGY